MRAILSTSDSELDHSILGIKPAERSTSTGDMQPTKNGYSSRPSPVKNGYDLTSEWGILVQKQLVMFLTITGWWYIYPSEKYESQWEEWHPIYEMENKTCLKPPSR